MPKFFCDYCEVSLPLSMKARKQHARGKTHRAKLNAYYSRYETELSQCLIDHMVRQNMGSFPYGYALARPPTLLPPAPLPPPPAPGLGRPPQQHGTGAAPQQYPPYYYNNVAHRPQSWNWPAPPPAPQAATST